MCVGGEVNFLLIELWLVVYNFINNFKINL